MGLSKENPNQSCEAYLLAQAQARGHAKALAQALVNFERNPDPHPERNAPNPAHSVTPIRIWRPMRASCDVRVEVTAECAAHNLAVSELRKP